VLALIGWLGAHGFLMGLLRFLVEIGLALITGLTLQWAWSPPTPGANDNASAVAAMLTCAERLAGELPDDVELWMVGTGAEEVGCCGMHGFVEHHAAWPADTTYYVNFECVGGGALHYIRSEGLLTKTHVPPALNEIARALAASGAFGEVTPTDLLAATDGHVPATRGYPTLSLITLEANGVPRNYHRPDDTVDAIDTAVVVRAADFAAAVAAAALRSRVGAALGGPRSRRYARGRAHHGGNSGDGAPRRALRLLSSRVRLTLARYSPAVASASFCAKPRNRPCSSVGTGVSGAMSAAA
jgi:hypothetical protein